MDFGRSVPPCFAYFRPVTGTQASAVTAGMAAREASNLANDGPPAEIWWRTLLPLHAFVAALTILISGFFLVRYVAALGPMDAYRRAAPCPETSAGRQDCYRSASGTLTDASFRPRSRGRGAGLAVIFGEGDDWLVRVTFASGSEQLTIPGSDSLQAALTPPTDVVATLYAGRIVQLDVRGQTLPTTNFPGRLAEGDRITATVGMTGGLLYLAIVLGLYWWVALASRDPRAEQILATGRTVVHVVFGIICGAAVVVIAIGSFLLARMLGLI